MVGKVDASLMRGTRLFLVKGDSALGAGLQIYKQPCQRVAHSNQVQYQPCTVPNPLKFDKIESQI